jgi:hypothetical protein
MPLPTITNVKRVAFPFSGGGQFTCVNVLNFRTTASEADLGAAIFDALDNGGAYNPWTALDSDFSCPTLEIIALDGASATVFVNGTPIEGDGTGDMVPNCAQVVSFHTTQRGPRGRGRVYIGPVTEGNITNGSFTDTFANGVIAQWETFIGELAALSPSIELVVASYTHADAHQVQSVTADRVAGTQRRRLDRLRA